MSLAALQPNLLGGGRYGAAKAAVLDWRVDLPASAVKAGPAVTGAQQLALKLRCHRDSVA
jgi:hypothetical protein